VGGELQQDKNPHKIHQSAKRDSTIKQQKQRMQSRRKTVCKSVGKLN
jgi:hypothetical protein